MRFARSLLGVLLAAAMISADAGAITPEQVAVVYNSRVESSERVAKHYAEARGVPASNVVPVSATSNDTIDRASYEREIVTTLRRLFAERRIASTVRVVVPVYGIPLRVGSPEPNEEERKMLLLAQNMRTAARQNLGQLLAALEALPGEPPPGAAPPVPESESDEALIKRVEESARKNLAKLKDTDAVTTPELQARAAGVVSKVGGVRALLQLLRPKESTDATARLEKMKRDLSQAEQIVAALGSAPSPQNRSRAYGLIVQMYGNAGLLGTASKDIAALRFDDGDASVDSELALLWWDRSDYTVAGRLPNPYFHRAIAASTGPTIPIPVMLVSRIDAPSPELALKLIDNSISAEKNGGPEGKVYIDARGIKGSDDSYGIYDQDLRNLAWLFREETSYSVELDDYDQTLSEPGAAPDVAVYVGWYKLRSYDDVFTFNPGAVGFHIASEEAISLHDPDERGWCMNALKRGISSTLGAVGEPFLESFPKPLELFGLLLTGRYTLVEAYSLTSPWLSWRLTLIGDPLYNPWKDRDWVDADELSSKIGDEKALNPLPVPPLQFDSRAPDESRKIFEQSRARLRSQLEGFYAKVKQVAEDAAKQKKGSAPSAKDKGKEKAKDKGKQKEPESR